MTSEQRFAELVEHFAGTPGVIGPGEDPAGGRRGFGAGALKINGSIFAMLSGGRLVVKLPAARVRELIAAGAGDPFDAGKGRPMKEWVAVRAPDPSTWRDLATEAAGFVGR
jgi:hypothetical protein